jgi:hypothetical protein
MKRRTLPDEKLIERMKASGLEMAGVCAACHRKRA